MRKFQQIQLELAVTKNTIGSFADIIHAIAIYGTITMLIARNLKACQN